MRISKIEIIGRNRINRNSSVKKKPIVPTNIDQSQTVGWYSGNKYERFMIWNRMHGPYHLYYWALILCNIIAPQFLWSKKLRSNLVFLWIISFVVSIGMWLERLVIVVTSLHRDYLPSSWGMYQPTFWDWSMFIGTIGFFFTLLFLFIRFLPMISIFEMRTILPAAEVEE